MSLIVKKYTIKLLWCLVSFFCPDNHIQSKFVFSLFGSYWRMRNSYLNSLTGDAHRTEKEILTSEAREFLRTMKIKNGILQPKIDSALPVFSHDSSWEFLNPFSEEFRGIYELYGMVMFQLLFIFVMLTLLVIFTFYKDVIVICENREDVITIIKTNSFNLRKSYIQIDNLCTLALLEKSREVETAKTSIKFYNKWIVVNNFYNKNRIRSDSFLAKIERFVSKFHTFSIKYNLLSFCSFLEFYWTAIPCIILVFISIPSFTLALALDETHKPEAWIKIIGNQWFWTYEYSGYYQNFSLSSNVLYSSDLTNNTLRLLQPDIAVTLPCNKVSRILVTSVDVIHCWAVPSLGVKIDAVPGRVNSLSILPTRAGFYYGQCSEICGVNHGFMPICVEVI